MVTRRHGIAAGARPSRRATAAAAALALGWTAWAVWTVWTARPESALAENIRLGIYAEPVCESCE